MNISISKVMSFSLLMFWITHREEGVLSDYSCLCFLAVTSGQPGSISDDTEVVTLIGSCQDAASLINQKEIHWGVSHCSCNYLFK